jgi:hypothetical protein
LAALCSFGGRTLNKTAYSPDIVCENGIELWAPASDGPEYEAMLNSPTFYFALCAALAIAAATVTVVVVAARMLGII